MRGALMAALLSAAVPQAPAAPELQFHHLHVRDGRPAWRIDFYERLFDPGVVTRITLGDAEGLQTGTRRILVSGAGGGGEGPTALWHLGWGEASLGETYLAHAQREVKWEPPLPPETLHLHVLSIAPLAAAVWYRDVLGADVEVPEPAPASRRLPPPEHRFPEARVVIGGLAVLIYPTDLPLVSSVDRGIDHVAFECDDLDGALLYFRRKRVRVLRDIAPLGEMRGAMIEGPDLVPIELVESPR